MGLASNSTNAREQSAREDEVLVHEDIAHDGGVAPDIRIPVQCGCSRRIDCRQAAARLASGARELAAEIDRRRITRDGGHRIVRGWVPGSRPTCHDVEGRHVLPRCAADVGELSAGVDRIPHLVQCEHGSIRVRVPGSRRAARDIDGGDAIS